MWCLPCRQPTRDGPSHTRPSRPGPHEEMACLRETQLAQTWRHISFLSTLVGARLGRPDRLRGPRWLRFDELNPPRGVAPARLRAHLHLSILSPGSHPAATGREQVSVGVGAEAFLRHLLSYFLSLGGLGFKSSPQALIRLQKGPAPSRVPRPPLVSFLACQLSRGTKVRPGVGPAHCLQAVPRAREETKLQAKLVETAPVFHSFTHGPLLVTQPGHAREVLCRPRLSPVTGRQGRQVKGVILF